MWQAVCLAALIVGQVSVDKPVLTRFEFEEPMMGTTFRLVLYCDDEAPAQSAARAAFARAAELNGVLSDYDPESEVRRLCDGAPHEESVLVSEELYTVLAYARNVSRQSRGAFDVTVGPLVRLWRQARRTKRMPSDERLQQALDQVGWRYVELHPSIHAVRLSIEGMRIDLGAIAKGYAADECLAVLRSYGIERALVDAGGDVVAGEAPPGQDGWVVGLASLDPDAAPVGYLALEHSAAATSGDTWQFVVIDGERYSHIVDPETGLGIQERRLVTVVASSGMASDAWASALSVLGPTAPLDLLGHLGGFDARVVSIDEKNEEHSKCTRQWGNLVTPYPQESG